MSFAKFQITIPADMILKINVKFLASFKACDIDLIAKNW